MEEKNFSSDSENEIENDMIKIKDIKKVLREKIKKSLNEEKKKCGKLAKMLFEVEVDMFEHVVDKVKSKPGRPSKSLLKLEDMIRIYCCVKEVDKKIRFIKTRYFNHYEKDNESELSLS